MGDIARLRPLDNRRKYTVMNVSIKCGPLWYICDKTNLSCPWICVFFFNLNLHHVTWVFNNFADICLVISTYFSHSAFGEVNESTTQPKFPKSADSFAEWGSVWLNHTECTMEGPEEEKNQEKVMCVPKARLESKIHYTGGRSECKPESFIVRSPGFLNCSQNHSH